MNDIICKGEKQKSNMLESTANCYRPRLLAGDFNKLGDEHARFVLADIKRNDTDQAINKHARYVLAALTDTMQELRERYTFPCKPTQ